MRRSLIAFISFAILLIGSVSASQPTAATSSGVVISEFRFRGPVGGNDEFVELLNAGTSAVDVSGWKLQGCASATGNASDRATIPAGVSLAAGQHYLFFNNAAAGYSGTVVGDQGYATGFTDGAGARIVSAAAVIVDSVGGSGTGGIQCREGTGIVGMPTTNGDQSYERRNGGTQDTDDNVADFQGPKPGNPQNRFSGFDDAPRVMSTAPANAQSGVTPNASITIAFSELVNVSAGWFSISCTVSSAHTATMAGGQTTFTLDPDSNFATSETCTVTVFAANVTDQDANDPPDNMAANYVFTFTTVAPPTLIREIQGASHISPKMGQTVSGVSGIVTARRSNGFYMQDPSPDADDATSEAIFVFTSSTPTVAIGDAVSVSGVVLEFRPGGSGGATNLTTTEISGPTFSVTSTGNPLPAPVVIGVDRVPPTSVIENDSAGDVESSGVFDPAADGIDFYESLEAMRVQVNDSVIVGPSRGPSIGELPVLANNGAGATGRTARGGIVVSAGDFNPERIFLDDEIMKFLGLAMPDGVVGDHLTTPAVGVIDYSFGNFKLEVTHALVRVTDGAGLESTGASGAQQLTVGTFNVQNLDPGDGAAQFANLGSLVVNNLRSPDLIGVEEIQDNNGATNTGVVSATVTLDMLVSAIETAGGPHYEYRLIDPANNQDGGEPGGNIRQAFLFRTDRGLAFIDRPGGGSTTATIVNNVGGVPELSASPGRIDPTSSAFNSSRKPLAGEFTYNGHHLYVIANHFNSKGGDQPLFGHFQPPVLGSEVQRMQQATIVRDFVREILAIDVNAEVVVIGDLNDFEFSNPVSVLKATPLNDLIEKLPANERYTYVFDGNSQTLDHILVSDSLADVATTDVVHVNAEFFTRASDHDPQVATLTLLDVTPPTLTVPADVSAETSATSCLAFVSDATLGTPTAEDNVAGVTIERIGVPAGNLFPSGTTLITYVATDAAGNTTSADQHVTVVDNTPPTIAPPANATYQLLSQVPGPGGATASDNCGAPAVTVVESSNGGSGSPASPLIITRTYTATDAAGNTASAIQTITVIDTTAPTITGAATTAANANGWYKAPVTIHFTCADNSGVVTCPADVTLSSDGSAQSVTRTATDGSGNTGSATVGPINIDQLAPTIAFGGSLSYAVDQNVAITCTISETLSGLDPAISQTCQDASGPAYAFTTGSNTLAASATDRAGNNATASTTFTVRVTTASLCRVISRMTTKPGVAISLCALAAAAEVAESRGLDRAHDALLRAYVREIERESGKSITPANADVLIRLGGEL
jgi:predicted extracellular nuclease